MQQLVIQTTWGHLIAWYLFFAGIGSGLYILTVGAKILRNDTSLIKIAYYISPALVVLSTCFLMLDLGQPLRAMLAALRPHSSMISVGTHVLSLFSAIGLWQGYCLFFGRRLSIFWDYCGIFLAFCTATYTGLLLGVVKAIPFWNNALLPMLFLVSALSSGVGLLLVLISREILTDEQALDFLPQIIRLDVVLIIVEASFLASLLLIALTGGTAAAASAKILLTGFFAVPFWLLVVGAGMLAPLIAKATGALNSYHGLLICGIGLMAAALALRYSIIFSGVWISLR